MLTISASTATLAALFLLATFPQGLIFRPDNSPEDSVLLLG